MQESPDPGKTEEQAEEVVQVKSSIIKIRDLVVIVLVIVLVSVVVMVILALLGPAIGNVFSNVVSGL